MIILRTFLTLGAGFATTAVILALATTLAHWTQKQKSLKNGEATAGKIAWNLGTTLVAAAAGGYVTATAALLNPLIHALVLALIVLLLSALSALQARGEYPVWVALLMVALPPCAVVAGGLLRLKQLGI